MKRDFLYREPLMPKKLSATNILKPKTEEEQREVEQAYDDAARAFARAILECAERHQEEWEKVYDKIDIAKKWVLRPNMQWQGKGGGEDAFLDALKDFEEKVADQAYRDLADVLGPSMFQAGWAFQAVYEIWKEEKRHE